ncbi:hypothetical protein ACFSR7_12500 [Cohnella sp. GCM10020058]|uniref:hypothetical protein n=1 Tax=Cohnella sp. GCM10020058 TaxID=3317330 RepID=UPI003645BF82
MEQPKFLYQDELLKLQIGEETAVSLYGRIFIIKRGDFDDIERIGKGFAFVGDDEQ